MIAHVRLSILCLLLLPFFTVVAQDAPDFSQFGRIPGYYNPAAVGFEPALIVQMAYRVQFISEVSQPDAGLFMVQAPIDSGRIGWGIVADHNQFGLVRTNTVQGFLSQRWKYRDWQVRAGVQLSWVNENVDFTRTGGFDLAAQQNAALSGEVDNSMGPSGGLGVFVASPKRNFQAGLSVINPIEYQVRNNQEVTRQIYASMSGRKKVEGIGTFIPQVRYRYSNLSDYLQANLCLDVKAYRLGVGVRDFNSAVAIVGMNYSVISIAYSFDYSITSTRIGSDRAQEIHIVLRFNKA